MAPPGRERLALGIDLGGTKIEGAIVLARSDDEYEVVARERIPTQREEGYEAVLARTASFVGRMVESAGARGGELSIGVGMPGGIERRTGHVKNSNTTCLNHRPFRRDLEAAVGRPIVFENDANCFALAEAKMGAARGVEGWIFGVILGTGVGGGWVAGGRIVSGLHGIAGEWGHHAVRGGDPDAAACYCGQRGCLEAYASGPAVERRYLALSGRAASVAEISAARPSDPHAEAAIESLLDTFGRALANVVDIADPACVVLGGGVSNLDVLYSEGRARVARYVFNDELLTPIVKHALGDSAGVLGAALLAIA